MKKNNKLPMTVIIVLMFVTVTIFIAYRIYVVKNSNNVFAVEDIFRVEVLGTDGYGYANVTLSPDFIEKSGVNISEFLYDTDKKNKLSNGDVITIMVINEAGIKLDKYKLTYEVSGLNKGTDLDIFKDIIISYDEKTKDIVIDNSMCSEFIKENVMFVIERKKEEYSLGDKVVIIGYVDMNAAADNRYNIVKTEYEYTVE